MEQRKASMYEFFPIKKLVIRPRAVGIKETGGVIADQITLFQSGEADFAHHINTPPRVFDLPTALRPNQIYFA